MSIALMSAAWRIDMPAAKKLVLLALCDWANDEGGSLYPSMAAIAARCSVSERTVQRIVHGMIDEGWIAVVGNETGGRGRTCRYQLNADRIVSSGAKKGDKSTPFAESKRVTSASERVTSTTVKGDIHVIKGDTAMSPDPLEEPSDNQDQEQQRSVVTIVPMKPDDSRRGTRLPDGWEPSSAVLEWAAAEFPAVNLPEALAEFSDYWRAVPGSVKPTV